MSPQHQRFSLATVPSAAPDGWPARRIAFTGTRRIEARDKPMVAAALVTIRLRYPDAIWITGGANGADAFVAEFGARHDMWVHTIMPAKLMQRPGLAQRYNGWQQSDPQWERWCKSSEVMPDFTTYLQRDDLMALRCEWMYAFPFDLEEADTRSGTWYTVRQARKQGKIDDNSILVLHPSTDERVDGHVTRR